MGTIHLLSQFVWPDAAPTAVYAEQLADELARRGRAVRLVGTEGRYRALARPAPIVPVERLRAWRAPRGFLPGVLGEYLAAYRAFARHIRRAVEPGDVVVATSAPPPTPWLRRAIHARGARAAYWLQDYYPDLVRAVWDPPAIARRALRARWDRALSGWDTVMSIGANLGYHGPNVVVRRNWPPWPFSAAERAAFPVEPFTALYAGNLGYAHDLGAFVSECGKLRAEGFQVRVRGDGPGLRGLPAWIETGPPFPDEAALRAALLRAEVHLVAAHPRFQESLFPSKLWPSLAAGRRVVATGFAGAMAEELRASLAADFSSHRAAAADTVEALLPPP